MIELCIPEATPSLNTTNRLHWTARRRLRAHWRRLVWVALVTAGGAQWSRVAPSYALVRIERFGKRVLDRDNLYGGCKTLIDALKDFHLILDDSPDHIHLDVVGLIHRTPSTRIRITEQSK